MFSDLSNVGWFEEKGHKYNLVLEIIAIACRAFKRIKMLFLERFLDKVI